MCKGNRPVGCDGRGEKTMKTVAAAQTQSKTSTLTLAFVALLGLGTIFVAGHAQGAALHDAAHDVRHTTGFPCH